MAKPDGLTITYEADPDEATMKAVGDGLGAYNDQFAAHERPQPLWLVVRDADGVVQAGLKGSTLWRWLYVDWLWIAEPFRRGGLGGRLLSQAEAVALERGCTGAYINTFTFQAPDFYPRHGYREVGRIEGFPPGHGWIWLVKALAQGGPSG